MQSSAAKQAAQRHNAALSALPGLVSADEGLQFVKYHYYISLGSSNALGTLWHILRYPLSRGLAV
jgi:hypothetical protein